MNRTLAASLLSLTLAPAALAETPKTGTIPLDYPVVATTAQTGDYVLAPSRQFLDGAFAKGIDKQTFIFYAAQVLAPGPAESQVKSLAGTVFSMPNSLIIPLRRAGQAKVGDILLSWWQSGSGLQRAIVVPGGGPKAPLVLYLDLDLDNPSGVGKKEDTLKPDTFHKLVGGLEPGGVVAVRSGAALKRAQLVNLSGDRALVVGFAGRVSAVAKTDLQTLPLVPKVRPGQQVMAPVFGDFKPVTVESVDARIGRVFVAYTFGGQPKKEAISFGEVVASLL
jgi:hypothetical protein